MRGIEDAAEALGASINGRKVGTFVDSAILSFYQNKAIATGEGGAVVTSSKEIYERLRSVRSRGRLEIPDYFPSPDYMDYVTPGYDFRMSNITEALGPLPGMRGKVFSPMFIPKYISTLDKKGGQGLCLNPTMTILLCRRLKPNWALIFGARGTI